MNAPFRVPTRTLTLLIGPSRLGLLRCSRSNINRAVALFSHTRDAQRNPNISEGVSHVGVEDRDHCHVIGDWQTHQLAGLATAIPWWFESTRPHQNPGPGVATSGDAYTSRTNSFSRAILATRTIRNRVSLRLRE